MPQKVKVTTDDGKSVIVTLDDEAVPSTPTASKTSEPLESAVSRSGGEVLGALTSPLHFAHKLVTDPKGLYDDLVNQSADNFTKASELWKAKEYGPAIHRAIAGAVFPYNVVPESADKIRSGNIAGGVTEAAMFGAMPKITSAIPSMTRGIVKAVPATGRAAVQVGTKAADLVSPDVVGVISPRAGQVLRVVQRLQGTKAGKASTADLSDILDEFKSHREAMAQPTEAEVAAAPSIAARRAATTAHKVRSEQSYQRPTFDDKEVLAEENARNPSVETPASKAARSAITQNVTLNQAMRAVRTEAEEAKIKLTAPETQAAMRLVKNGKSPQDVMDAITVMRQLKASPSMAGLPTDAEMQAEFGRQARAGKKSLMPRYGSVSEPAMAMNPFRP